MRRLLLLAVLGFALPSLAGAQRQPLPPPGQTEAVVEGAIPTAIDAALDSLLVLPGTWVEVRYPAETLDRSSRVQARLEILYELWQPMSAKPLGWLGAALTEPLWREIGTDRPWGMPARFGDLFLFPAYGDVGTVATASRLLGGAPPTGAGVPVLGTAEEAGSLVLADVVLQLELARAFVETAGFRCEEPWICGVLASLAARLAWETAEPGRTLEVVGLLDRIAAAQGGAGAHRLEEYGPGLPLETDLWFQAQFVRGADPIWVQEGRYGGPRRLRRWLKQRDPVSRVKLDKEYPELVDWRAAAFAP